MTTIFTSNNCSFCKQAKEYLNKIGEKFTERNVSTDKEARAEMNKHGFMSVPVIHIKGKWLLGFDRSKIRKLLGK